MTKLPIRSLRACASWLRAQREQWLSPEELRNRQWRRLGEIVAYAGARSPFYRRRFDDAGFDPRQLRAWSDFAKIPPTTREDLRDPDLLIVEGVSRERLERALTSGSTGRPTTTYWDRDGWILSKYLLKARARRACGLRTLDRIALLQEIGAEDESRRRLPRLRAFSIHRPIADTIAALRAYEPAVIYGFPGHLARLAQQAAGAIAPRLIFTSGEMLDGATRKTIELGLGAPVYDIYGCTEVKEIAWECPARSGYHVNADWIIVEVEPDDRGTLLVTSLANRGMPLLRYRLGDTGALMTGSCSCGRGLPLMAPGWGRSVDYVVRRDGGSVSPYALTCALETIEALSQYKVVQEAVDRVVVHVVPGAGFGHATEREVRDKLRPLLGGLDPVVKRVTSIAASPSGKFRIVESHCGNTVAR